MQQDLVHYRVKYFEKEAERNTPDEAADSWKCGILTCTWACGRIEKICGDDR